MLFPFDLPFPTAFYLTLLVLVFALHQAFMHYVLAGSLYVAWAVLFPGTQANIKIPRYHRPLAAILRDWMPFLLSAAITAGVAPLLFIQIVYQKQFYTANLLLFWRWMIVVPVLIVAFYLLYLLKSSVMTRWPLAARAAVAVLAAGSFVFVGFCWTANHLVGMSEPQWPEIYATGQLPLVAGAVIARMAFWIGGAFATMSIIVGWQLNYLQSRRNEPIFADDIVARETRTLACLSLSGLGLLVVSGLASFAQSTTASRDALFSSRVFPYVVLASLGVVSMSVCWIIQWRWKRLDPKQLAQVSGTAVLSLLCISFVREAMRTSTIDLTQQYSKHAEASEIGGFGVFVFFTIVVSAAIVWCFLTVARGMQAGDSRPSP